MRIPSRSLVAALALASAGTAFAQVSTDPIAPLPAQQPPGMRMPVVQAPATQAPVPVVTPPVVVLPPPLWPIADAQELLTLIQSVVADGLSPKDYAPTALADAIAARDASRVSLVATDNKNAGYLGGKELGRLLGGKGKVVLLRYQQNSASTELREAGFLDAIKESPEIKIISENQYAGATADSAQKRAEQMLDTLREADGVFCSNESATQGMLNALERASMLGADQKLKFVGFDKSGPLLKALGEGKIHALVAQNPEKMGYEAVKAMVQHLNGKPVPAVIDTGAIVITRQNLGSAEVKKLLNR